MIIREGSAISNEVISFQLKVYYKKKKKQNKT
jgi:hypothetical protein